MDENKKYDDWIDNSRTLQVRYITLLTAGLYFIYGLIDYYVAPKEYLYLFHLIHIYIIPSFLFTIAILSFFKNYKSIMIKLLIIATIFSSIGNFVILRVLDSPTIYFPELYLSILWVLIVSGLRLNHAIFTASIMGIISIVSVFFLKDTITSEQFVLHIFWIFCSISFGFLGAYLIEKISKEMFLSKEAISKLAITDKLTGLYNRAKFDEVIEIELSRAKRYKQRFALMIIDVDYFKAVNDNYGHIIGDIFLKEISSLLKSNIRESDFLFRWGGEEFVLLSPLGDKEGLKSFANNLKKIISEHNFEYIGNKTVSIGVTQYEENDSATTIVKRADNALYDAKNNGRNCVFIK